MKLLPVVSAVALALFAGSTIAAPINPINPRPSVIGASPVGEATLQDIITGGPTFNPNPGVFPGSGINVNTDQSVFGMFKAASNPANALPTLVAEYTANASTHIFGIWFGTDTSNIVQFDLFTGSAVRGSAAAVSIDEGVLEVFGGGSGASACGPVVCDLYFDALISANNPFGFYFKPSSAGPTYFTVDQLNPTPDQDRVLAFTNGATTNWAFAYEDGTDFDYNDMVVKVEALSPVPEPSTYAMLGVGLLGVGLGLSRNRRGARR